MQTSKRPPHDANWRPVAPTNTIIELTMPQSIREWSIEEGKVRLEPDTQKTQPDCLK